MAPISFKPIIMIHRCISGIIYRYLQNCYFDLLPFITKTNLPMANDIAVCNIKRIY